MRVSEIAAELFREKPTSILYHYTSLKALQPIIQSAQLHATDVRFLNDSAELNHTASLLRGAMARSPGIEGKTTRLYDQFRLWLGNRLTLGHAVFVTCFTANGNLLSQWRSYGEPAKGISLGFAPELLSHSAGEGSFRLARCIYDPGEQAQIALAILKAVELLAAEMGESKKLHADNSFHEVFGAVEGDLLQIAALLKHPAFKEEEEWRAVSAVIENYVTAPIEYREGSSTMVPYIRLDLPTSSERAVDLHHVFIGPTPHVNNAVSSVAQYLTKGRASPRVGVGYCAIPYRTW